MKWPQMTRRQGFQFAICSRVFRVFSNPHWKRLSLICRACPVSLITRFRYDQNRVIDGDCRTFRILRPISNKTISEHFQNLYKAGELGENSVVRKFRITAADGKEYDVKHYSLDAIPAVGYKVNSNKATEFQKWASTVLKGNIENGYALNGKKHNSDPAALLKLAQEVRAIRTSEKNLYTQVRETFAQCSLLITTKTTGQPVGSSPTVRMSPTSQPSEQTAAEIVRSRADASKPNMGLVGLGNRAPTAADVTVAKNYCTPT